MQDEKLSSALKLIAQALEQIADATGVNDAVAITCPPQASVKPEPPKVVTPPKAIQYDNDPNSASYDPEPPMPVEKVPPRAAQFPPDKVILAKDSLIHCKNCKRDILKAIRDIDGSKEKGKGLSLDAFEILIEGIAFSDTIALYSEETGRTIDCPACGGPRTLWLVGGPKPEVAVGVSEGVQTL